MKLSRSPVLQLLISLFLLVLAGWLGSLQLAQLTHVWHSATWPATQGEVLSATAIKPARRYQAMLTYRYLVQEREYLGETTVQTNASTPAQALRSFGRGAPVTVHYDPDGPARSVLRTDPTLALFGSLALALLVTVAATGMLLWAGARSLGDTSEIT